MELLFVLVGLILLPVAAVKGTWHRGVYLALAIGGIVLAALFGQMPLGVNPRAGVTTADQAQAVDAVIMVLLSMSVGMAIGGVLGACLYQPKKPQVST
jgi:hypothetical protein